MVSRYLIDTSAISQYLEERFPNNGLLFMDDVFATESNISVITKIELLTWKPTQDDMEEKVAIVVDDSIVFNLSPEIVLETIRLRRKYHTKTPDAIIAATALVHGFTLITDNERDFNNIKNLKWINPNKL
jgi:predicted nucleic acid-binding protein